MKTLGRQAVNSIVIACGSGSGTGGDGILKWKILPSDDITVSENEVYDLCGDFWITDDSKFSIAYGGRLCVDGGALIVDGVLCNDGEIYNDC